jgi:cysteine desulfurase/selenocysteine lyase
MLDTDNIRKDFPILGREVYGRPLVYLDNAATTQKPLCVLDAMREEYLNQNANVHRGVHYLSQRATELHEAARDAVQHFLNAARREEIVFTRGTTEAINLVASTFTESQMEEGDEVIVTEMEHHSNIVPWQLAEQRHGIRVKVWPITDDGRLSTPHVGDGTDSSIEAAVADLITPRTKLIAVTHVSNVLGVVNPVKEIVAAAHAHGVPVLVDAAQSAPHLRLDVQDMGCDFLCLSGHKMYGPTGIGVLYGKSEWLDRLPPYQGGGEMIERVSFTRGTTFERAPLKFEAGTPDYIATHGLATAIRYMERIGMEQIAQHEHQLTQYAVERLSAIEGMKLLGAATPTHTGVLSFLVGDIHPLDMGTLLDRLGIAVRTGHHCAQPLMERLGITGTVRASLAMYNTRDEVDALCNAIERVRKMF